MRHTVKIGQNYGGWKVIEKLQIPSSNKSYKFNVTKFKVRCQSCYDTTRVMPATIIVNEKVKQCRYCGFKNREQYNKKDVGEISLGYYNRIKHDAITRKLEFVVSQEFIWQLYQKQLGECALTGESIEFGSTYNSKDRTASLDRIDSSKGYTESNVQWIHRNVNQMKWNFKQENFLQTCIQIANYAKQNFNKYQRTTL